VNITNLIDRILIEFAVEYGVYLLQPNDPQCAEEISLADYLTYKSWMVTENELDSLEAVKSLPEGYVPIKDIEQLKTLKKGCSKNIPENRVWKTNIKLYQYSPEKKIYYRRQFWPLESIINKAIEYINKGILYGP